MPRTYVQWGDWSKLNLKKTKGNYEPKVDENKKAAQKAKFGKCRICGGQMTYLGGTNILICENEVEKKKTKIGETGEKVEYTVTEECGNINLVDAQYQSYMHYLFD